MITKDEILSVADEIGLTPPVVEKDYVLGWLLAAVDANAELSDAWVFKGGTCLKKCYFETYRFSEDLDFTLKDEVQLDETFLKTQFASISEWLYDEAGIEIPVDRLIFDVHPNPRGRNSCEGRVYYQSYFASGKRSIPKIKFDLTADEVLVLPPSKQKVFHTYSDVPPGGIHIDCYSYPEVFGEKVRALGERGRPRDLYDVINLFRNDHLPPAAVVQEVLSQKCVYKGIEMPVLHDMDGYKEVLYRNWEPMLAHQLPALPSLEAYWEALPEFFDWLEGRATVEKTPLGSVSSSGEVFRPLYGQLGLKALNGNSLEIIRFAAGNRLCIDLDYTDKSGVRKNRVIEPYSLRQAKNGNILLFGVRVEDGGIRAYKIDQINNASITNQVFVPRYQVELSPSGGTALSAQSLGALDSLDIPHRSSGRRQARPARRVESVRRTAGFSQGGPIYVYLCPVCNKTFKRKKQNPKLNAHKTKEGWLCSGRVGIFKGIKI
ncbi:nucleotidyl transferase AbiEii/AbiGii toxin family protein [Porticoccus sp. GXU_MW_L64]